MHFGKRIAFYHLLFPNFHLLLSSLKTISTRKTCFLLRELKGNLDNWTSKFAASFLFCKRNRNRNEIIHACIFQTALFVRKTIRHSHHVLRTPMSAKS